MVHLPHPSMTTGKTIAFTSRTSIGKVMSLLFSMLSRFVIAFYPRSKRLLISLLQSPSAVILESKIQKLLLLTIGAGKTSVLCQCIYLLELLHLISTVNEQVFQLWSEKGLTIRGSNGSRGEVLKLGKSPKPAAMLVYGREILKWIIEKAEKKNLRCGLENRFRGIGLFLLVGLFRKTDCPEYWRKYFQDFLYEANELMNHKTWTEVDALMCHPETPTGIKIFTSSAVESD